MPNSTRQLLGQGEYHFLSVHLIVISLRKYHHGKYARKAGVQWGLTGIEVDPETGKTITVDLQLLPYNRRDAQTIAPRIAERMHPGGCIYTDCWAAYPKSAELAQCTHKTVNHKKNFKDPITGVHTNNVEGQ